MKEYYFLASLLPPLEIGHVPTLGSADLKELLKVNLTPDDLKKTQKLFRFIDLENMRAFWANEPFDPRGNLNREEMEVALAHEQWSPDESFELYLSDYLAAYPTNADRLKHFPLLMSQFFAFEAQEGDTDFLSNYFNFQREMRLVMVGFRAKKLKKDVVHELQYEDPADPIVAQILAQRDAKEFEPPFEYKELRPIFEEFGDSPLDLHKAIYAYEFDQVNELLGSAWFSIDRILSYIVRLRLVERWLELDFQKGIQIVDKIEKEVK